mgnify:CR=1 FL=1
MSTNHLPTLRLKALGIDTYKEAVLANTKHRSDIIAAFKKTTGIDPTETQIQDAINAGAQAALTEVVADYYAK